MSLDETFYRIGKPVDWTATESQHSRTGQLPGSEGVNAEIYRALMHECDARKTEALILDRAADPLLTVRGLLFRGRLKESSALLGNLQPGTSPQLLLEEARLAAFNGDWASCGRLCKKAYAANPPAITRLALFQVGALAHFEQGDFAAASLNLSLIESMKTDFPKCISVFYAELLRLRILAREGSARAADVRARIGAIWKRWLADGGDLDQLQALLRVEVDLRRIWKLPQLGFALGSYLAAAAMGEELYAALALVECYVSAPAAQRERLRALAFGALPSFERVRRVFAELAGDEPASTSVQAMRESLAESSAETLAFDERRLQAASLALPEYGIVVNLAPFRAQSTAGYAQFARIFEALAGGKLLKEEFFQRVWGKQKYVSHLHDGLIYTALYRLKRVCGVQAVIREGEVCLEGVQVIV